ncbi:MAG: phage integrase N-terminal SAM-like domain-containing protein [Spirulina sp.]
MAASASLPRRRLDQGWAAIRLKHYSYHTEQTYRRWLRRCILFHNNRHPNQRGESEIEAFFAPSGGAGSWGCLTRGLSQGGRG